jgi:hypothetical protein
MQKKKNKRPKKNFKEKVRTYKKLFKKNMSPQSGLFLYQHLKKIKNNTSQKN